MIFVILGTQKFRFTRLIKEISRLVDMGILNEKVIIQNGSTQLNEINNENIIAKPYMEINEFNEHVENAEIIICHGGTGAIVSSIKKGKSVIAFPRMSKNGEHINDHQQEIIDQFLENEWILSGEISELAGLIEKAKITVTPKYESNTSQIIGIINNYLDN